MRSLYRRWIVANGWSELLGLGGTFILAFALAGRLTAVESPAGILLGATLAIAFGTLLEGVLIGVAQGRVIHAALSGVSTARWTIATALGAGAAWTLGMLPSTIVGLFASQAAGATPAPEPLVGPLRYVLAAGLGLLLGPFLGIPQFLVLRRHVPHAGRWVLANAAAWALGMPAVFVGMHLVGPDPTLPRFALGAAVTGLAAGLVVGAIHGRWLVLLLFDRDRDRVALGATA